MKRAIWIAASVLSLLVACQPASQVSLGGSTPTPTPHPHPSSSARPSPAYLLRGPFLKSHTGLRLLVSGDYGLQLADIDSGATRLLVKGSDANGEFWFATAVKGGAIVQGGDGTGAGWEPVNAWYVANAANPSPRLLGRATWSIDEPSGGVWLAYLPHSDGGNFGSGTITLVNTRGEMIRRGTVRCCHRFDASLGDGRFITDHEEGSDTSDDSYQSLTVYDAFSERVVRRLTPVGTDAEFLRMEGQYVVWKPYECPKPCYEHIVDPISGRSRTRPWNNWTASPDSAHRAREVGDESHHHIEVDGQAMPNSESAGVGIEWSPDGKWLLFVRPDKVHLGVWHVGDAGATTDLHPFSIHMELWSIFDQR